MIIQKTYKLVNGNETVPEGSICSKDLERNLHRLVGQSDVALRRAHVLVNCQRHQHTNIDATISKRRYERSTTRMTRRRLGGLAPKPRLMKLAAEEGEFDDQINAASVRLSAHLKGMKLSA
jgi:hypothetical protein